MIHLQGLRRPLRRSSAVSCPTVAARRLRCTTSTTVPPVPSPPSPGPAQRRLPCPIRHAEARSTRSRKNLHRTRQRAAQRLWCSLQSIQAASAGGHAHRCATAPTAPRMPATQRPGEATAMPAHKSRPGGSRASPWLQRGLLHNRRRPTATPKGPNLRQRPAPTGTTK